MRSTLWAIWLLVPDPFFCRAPCGPFGYWFLTPFSAPIQVSSSRWENKSRVGAAAGFRRFLVDFAVSTR